MHEKIIDFLNTSIPGAEYPDGTIWQKMGSEYGPIMDIDMNFVESYDDGRCSVDFSDEQQLCSIFFSGDCSYFAGIWIGNDEKYLLDQMPIYIIGLETDDEIETVGNFRKYIGDLLDEFIYDYDKQYEYFYTALLLQEKLKKFSQNIISKGNYTVHINDYN